MRRALAVAALGATALFGYGGPAHAICAGSLLCAVDGCTGTVNVCPTARQCSGGVSVCPTAHPRDCHSSVDVCLGPLTICIPCIPPH